METTATVEDLSLLIGDAIPRAARSERGPINPRCLVAGTNRTYVAPPRFEPEPGRERRKPVAPPTEVERVDLACVPFYDERIGGPPPGVAPMQPLIRNGRVVRRRHRLFRGAVYYECRGCSIWKAETAFRENANPGSACGRASYCLRCENLLRTKREFRKRFGRGEAANA